MAHQAVLNCGCRVRLAAGRAQNHVMLHMKMMASHLKDRFSNLEPNDFCRRAESPLRPLLQSSFRHLL